MPTLNVNGHQVTVDDSFLKLSPEQQDSTVDEIAKSLPAAPAAPAAPSGAMAGVQQGLSDVMHGPAETLKQFAGADTSGLEGVSKSVAPGNYVPAQPVISGHGYNPLNYSLNLSQLPQTIAEAAPGMAADIAAARLGSRFGGPIGAVIGGVGAHLLRTSGDTSKNDAAIRTGNPDAQPEFQDKARALATGVAEGLPMMKGLNRFLPGVAGSGLSKVLKTAGVEGVTGTAQHVISQAGATVGTDKGLTVDPAQALSAGLTNAATGAGFAAPRAHADAAAAKRFAPLEGNNADATKAFVARVQQAADGNSLAPQGLSGSTSAAATALRTADGSVRSELKDAIKPIKKTVDTDTADALRRATKGETLTDSDLQNVTDNTTPDIAHLVRQAHVASLIKDMGDYVPGQRFSGGLANGLEHSVRALQNPRGAVVSGVLGGLGLGGHAASMFAYGPPTLAAIGGMYGAARGIDAFTGNRSPLKSIVDRFSDPNAQQRLPAPEAPQAPAVPPTGPKVPFNPGVAGGGSMLALGQNPFVPKPSTAPAPIDATAQNADIQGMLRMAAARRNVAAQQAAQSAPSTPDVSGMNEQVKSALLMASARRKVAAQRAAMGLAQDSPLVQENGGASLLSNPEFAKAAGKFVSGARAHAALTAQPEEEGQTPTPDVPSPPTSPQAPVGPSSPAVQALLQRLVAAQNGPAPEGPAPVDPVAEAKVATKISKKNGKVNVEASPEYTGDYVPLQDHELFGKGISDKAFADIAKTEPGVQNPDGYAKSVIRDRQKRRGVLADITGDAPIEDQEHAGELLDQLHHIRRGAQAAKAIKHYTEKMSPETRDAIRKRMDASFINSMWSK